MNPTQTELDTFKVMSNVDFVDWSRASKLLQINELDDDVQIQVTEEAEKQEEQEDLSEAPEKEQDSAAEPPSKLKEEQYEREREDEQDEQPGKESYAEEHQEEDLRNEIPTAVPVARALPKLKSMTAAEENEDYEVVAEKEALLQELLQIERSQNVKLARKWDVHIHTLDELQFEYDRVQSELNSVQIVDMAKSGIKFGIGGLEAVLKRSGLSSVDGWYNESCKDMSKYNRPLLRIYKKYYRKTSMSPIMELGMLMFGSLAWTVFQNKMGFRKSSSSEASSTSATSSAAAAPRASSFEPQQQAPSSASSAGPKMRPPTMPGIVRGPSWSSANTAAAPANAAQEVRATNQPQVEAAQAAAQAAQAQAAAAAQAQAAQAQQAQQQQALAAMSAQTDAILKMMEQMNQQSARLSNQIQEQAEQSRRTEQRLLEEQQRLAAELRTVSLSQAANVVAQSSVSTAAELLPSTPKKRASARSSPASSLARSTASSPRLRVSLATSSSRRTATARRRAAERNNVIDL